jgi:hypothetical protein
MKNLPALIEAILDAYDDVSLLPKPNGTTFCNIAVYGIAHALGCNQLDGKNADDILAFLISSNDWQAVPMIEAQDLANAGSLLIAGLNSTELGQAHGHVVVVRPGVQTYSGKWGLVPRVLNIGSTNFIARGKSGPLTNAPVGINESFIPKPHIFAWKPSL